MKIASKIATRVALFGSSLLLAALSSHALASPVPPKSGEGLFYSAESNTALLAAEKSSLALELPWMTDEGFEKDMKAATERAKRTIASEPEASENMMSKELKDFRKEFLAVQNSAQLDALLEKLDRNYDSYPNDLKFLAAQLIPLKTLRGIVWKMVPLFSKAKFTQSALASMVQQLASAQRVFFPTPQWRSGFEYLTEPMAATDLRFNNMTELQLYFVGPVYRSVVENTRRLYAFNLSQKPIIWDNQFLYGTASFRDDLDRYRTLGEAERQVTLAGMQSALYSIAMFRAYEIPKFLELTQDIGKLIGVDGFLLSPVDGVTARDRTAVMKKHTSNFTLSPSGTKWTNSALRHLRQAVQHSSIAWKELKERPASRVQMIDAAALVPFDRQAGLTIEQLLAMVKGRAQVRSAITGDTIDVDLPKFFQNPPKSLLTLLPTDFEGGEAYHTKALAGGGSAKYRNYYRGRPTAWNLSAYQAYFPGLNNQTRVQTAARILSQAWGGFLPGIPLAAFVQ